ncbi:NADAR family protein [Streptococcus parasanguinis]|uniref:NADAR family protein n=1 Tax=Streptococcus parasanguinis TaxID=1318 RepID=UPI001898EEA6|nr:NADAR family protein [Streptococcus parasanguinis]MDB8622589.1 NADAR family protein [Streptococcus parasanguinis]
MKEIKFYKVNDDYGFMSNFAPYSFSDGSNIWPTSEHYFQAQKFLVPEIQEKIRQIVSPMDAAIEGRNRQNPLRPDWEEVKDKVMLQALRMKFIQNPEIAKELLATGDAILIEHTRNDDYWADGGDGSGKNKLGLLLMQVREELKNSTL